MVAVLRSPTMLDVAEQRSAWRALERLGANLLGENDREPATDLLVLHGATGTGKSFLVSTLREHLADRVDVQVVAAENAFPTERSTRASTGRLEGDPDLLAVEDIQHLPPGSVETFIDRLDDRRSRRRPTLVTASAGPRHLQHRGKPYPARLTSRLAGSLVVNIPLPGPESLLAALERFLADSDLDAPRSVVNLIARTSRNLRTLQGAVSQLEILARLDGGSLKPGPLLEHFQKQTLSETSAIDRIVQRVARTFKVSVKDVRSKNRQRGFVVPRHVSMYLARRLTTLSLQQIASHFGDCDHATVLHACRKMEKTLADNPELGGAVEQLRNELM